MLRVTRRLWLSQRWYSEQVERQVTLSNEQEQMQNGFIQHLGGAATSLADLEEVKQKTEEGDIHAMGRLGVSYLYGVDGIMPPNEARALEILYKAGVRGSSHSFNVIGRYFAVDGEEGKAYEWYERSAKMGDGLGAWEVGYRLENGIGIKKDAHEAVRWYGISHDDGDAKGTHNLAICYLTGQGGLDKSPEKAKELLQIAAKGHIGEAHYQLSILEEKEGNLELSKEYLVEAAKLDTPEAQYNLALSYKRKMIEPPNPKRSGYDQEAVKWLDRAAILDLVDGQVLAAYHFSKGIGTDQDEDKATNYFMEAAKAEKSTVATLFVAAHRCFKGIGLPEPDTAKAMSYINTLANGGNILAASLRNATEENISKNLQDMEHKLFQELESLWISEDINTKQNVKPFDKLKSTKAVKTDRQVLPRKKNVPIFSFKVKE